MGALEQIKKWRRQLHQIPELGLQEYQTSNYLKKELIEMGYDPISILDTGILVYIDHHQDKTVAFRSDMDGLKISEQTNCDFKSKHDGYMHACGHDGHMAALLALAKRLKESDESFDFNILLIFQPAEEAPGGAKLLVEQGILQKYHVEAIF